MTQSNKIIARTLIPLLRQAVWNKEIREIIQKSGFDVTPVNYYSSIPSFVDIENSFEYQTDQTNPPYHNDSIFQKKLYHKKSTT
ncbi:MAG TPA: hypothetical protein PLH65_00785 [bacterium]|nr:hypothetical protein [bacterium]HPN67287.1 hypothetical protein [bacterium]